MADEWVLKNFSLTGSGAVTKEYLDENNVSQKKTYLIDGKLIFNLNYVRGTNILKQAQIYYRY